MRPSVIQAGDRRGFVPDAFPRLASCRRGARPDCVLFATSTTPVSSARASALLLKLVDGLFHHPAIPVPGAASQLKVTQRAASQNIGKLVRAGLFCQGTYLPPRTSLGIHGRPSVHDFRAVAWRDRIPSAFANFLISLSGFSSIDGAPGKP